MDKFISGAVLIVIVNCFQNVFSAPTVLALNADRLSLLGQHGYEVISKAEEFITPVNNKIDHEESHNPLVQPDMLLYGKFYVLRKKDLHQDQLPLHAEAEASEPKKRSSLVNSKKPLQVGSTPAPVSVNNLPSAVEIRSSVFQSQQQKQSAQELLRDDDSIITFPNDSTTKAPKAYKYVPNKLRQGTVQNDESVSIARPSRIFPHPAETSASIPAPAAVQNLPNLTPASHQLKEEDEESQALQHDSSDEFVDWVVRNLKSHQIQKLLRGEEISDYSIEDSKDDDQFEIANKHFIQTPPRIASCPEGQRRNHNGVCVKPYVHRTKPVSLQARLKRGKAQIKLAALFQSIVRAEMELLRDFKAVEEIEATSSTTTTPEETTTITSPSSSPAALNPERTSS